MASSFWAAPAQPTDVRGPDEVQPAAPDSARCRDFLAFLGICFERDEDLALGLHPFLANHSPSFDDAFIGGGSFDVRKVRSTAFPKGLDDKIFEGREFVAVKHPKMKGNEGSRKDVFSDIASDLQIIRYAPLREHRNIVDLLAVTYYDAGDANASIIIPALVLEYADLGSVHTYQEQGYGRSVEDKVDILLDTASGLQALHDAGIIHGDLKASNLLVCKSTDRKFTIKLTDFGFSFTADELHIVGGTEHLDAPEGNDEIDVRYSRQIDIYSFGLLLYSVLKNGANFFEPTEHTDQSHIRKLKTSGLLTALLQLNVLNTLRGDRMSLILVCHILAYCHQPNPAHRFREMTRVITLLERVDNRFPKSNSSDMCQELPAETCQNLMLLSNPMSEFMKRELPTYCASFQQRGLQMPMIDSIERLLFERIDAEVIMSFGDRHLGGSKGATWQDTLFLTKAAMGVIVEQDLAFQGLNETKLSPAFFPELSLLTWRFQKPRVVSVQQVLCS